MRLILGTAALSGTPYAGKCLTRDDASAVVARALHHGIRTFDTSPSYGFAEDVLSEQIGINCTVYTKHQCDTGPDALYASIRKLSAAHVILMAHNLFVGQLPHWASGFSAYSSDPEVPARGIAQYDCSIINRKMLQRRYGRFAARSVFLRGGLAGSPVPAYVGPSLLATARLAASLRMVPPALALQWALQQEKITGVIVGPSSVQELDQIMEWYHTPCQHLGDLVSLIPSVDVDLRTWN